MPARSVPPSIEATAFSCPYCGAYTTQYWHSLAAKQAKDNETPHIPDAESKANFANDANFPSEERKNIVDFIDKMMSGDLFFESIGGGKTYYDLVCNCWLSKCYNCGKMSIWLHQKMIYPPEKGGPEPNRDLGDDIIRDYEEARSVLNLSPRSAAALLRLCVQKICIKLGENGKNIDDDIANLVSKGLADEIKESLDIVRVIGNESVHPGQMDISDDRETALKLFDLINIIAREMITVPNERRALYDMLPEGKKKAIEARDSKAKGKG